MQYTHTLLNSTPGREDHEYWGSVRPTRTSLLASPDRAVIITNELISGKGKNTGAPWSRWRETNSMSISTRRAGKINVYNVMRTPTAGRQFTNVSNSLHYFELFRYPEAIRAIQTVAGQSVTDNNSLARTIYPIVGHYYDAGMTMPLGGFHSSISRYMREDSFENFVRRMFGKTRYRKDLVKTLAETPPINLAYLYELRGLVPVDWIIDTARARGMNRIVEIRGAYTKHVSDVVSLIPESRRRRFVMSIEDGYMARDVLQFWHNAGEDGRAAVANARTWQEAHDLFWGDRRGVRAAVTHLAKNEPIEFRKHQQKIVDAALPDHTFVLPEDTDTLRGWSEEMHNCISGYAVQAKNGQVDLVGVYKDDVLVANLEIRHRELKQILGKYNQPLSEPLRSDIVDSLVRSGSIDRPTGRVWGLDDPTQDQEINAIVDAGGW